MKLLTMSFTPWLISAAVVGHLLARKGPLLRAQQTIDCDERLSVRRSDFPLEPRCRALRIMRAPVVEHMSVLEED